MKQNNNALKQPVIIGIRHHSPACARLVSEKIRQIKPKYVLIEGPMDFNPRLDELFLGHRLPLAIYSFGVSPGHRENTSLRRGSWSPFVEYSPEWQALVEGKAAGAELRFIDLPAWHDAFSAVINRYADAEDEQQASRAREYETLLCEKLGISGYDTLWDHLFEGEQDLNALAEQLDYYFSRLRQDDEGSLSNRTREAMMARWISWAMQRDDGEVLVVCGGYHAPALRENWQAYHETSEPHLPALQECLDVSDEHGDVLNDYVTGSYLVPYSNKRLDAFTGYASGMPSPAFQEWSWQLGAEKAGLNALEQILRALRAQKQPASTADMSAIYLRAQGLARLRSHRFPLRIDWLDAIAGSLIKEALTVPLPWSYRGTLRAGTDPILVCIMQVLTGERYGELSKQTPQPPLLDAIFHLLKELEITLQGERVCDLLTQQGRRCSQALHQLNLLGIPGISRRRGPQRAMSGEYEEIWQLASPLEQRAALIEAAFYGATLEEAAQAKLEELLSTLTPQDGLASGVARLLNLAALAGLHQASERLLNSLPDILAQETRFEQLGEVLSTVHALYRDGETLGMKGIPLLLTVLQSAFDRALWLSEANGEITPSEINPHITTVQSMRDIIKDILSLDEQERTSLYPGLEAERALAVWQRKSQAVQASPLSRGAALGALLSVTAIYETACSVDVQEAIRLLQHIPLDNIGDALSGLIALARHQLTEHPDFITGLDALVSTMEDDAFIHALPAMRAAFAWLPPRERGDIASQVLKLHNQENVSAYSLSGDELRYSPELIATLRVMEQKGVEKLQRWGIWNEPSAE